MIRHTPFFCAQLWVKPSAPSNVQLKRRPREDFGVEHAFYCSASNRRNFIFPLLKLPYPAKRLLETMLKSDVGYDYKLLPADPEDVVADALAAIHSGEFEGCLPGKGRSKLSALHPAIKAAEDAHIFAFGAQKTTRGCRTAAVSAWA